MESASACYKKRKRRAVPWKDHRGKGGPRPAPPHITGDEVSMTEPSVREEARPFGNVTLRLYSIAVGRSGSWVRAAITRSGGKQDDDLSLRKYRASA